MPTGDAALTMELSRGDLLSEMAIFLFVEVLNTVESFLFDGDSFVSYRNLRCAGCSGN